MNNSILKQIADLENLSYKELQLIWKILFGKTPPVYNRTYIINRLAYRIQELHYGGLSESARSTMDEMLPANGFDENACRKKDRTRKSLARRLRVPGREIQVAHSSGKGDHRHPLERQSLLRDQQ